MVTRYDHPVQIHMMDAITYPCLDDKKTMLVKGPLIAQYHLIPVLFPSHNSGFVVTHILDVCVCKNIYHSPPVNWNDVSSNQAILFNGTAT